MGEEMQSENNSPNWRETYEEFTARICFLAVPMLVLLTYKIFSNLRDSMAHDQPLLRTAKNTRIHSGVSPEGISSRPSRYLLINGGQ